MPSTQNTTADIISKGGKRKDIEKVLRGPEMLYTPSLRWYKLPIMEIKEEVDVEKEYVSIRAVDIDESVIDVKRVSSWKKLLRITSYIYKFISKKSYPADIKDKMSGVKEIEMKCAIRYWILQAQKQLDLSSKQIEKLCPFKGDEEIVRIYGRIIETPLFDLNRKHPLLLSRDHEISTLIVKQVHEDICHPGHLRVITEVRKEFWIIGIRYLSKLIGRNCVICRRWRGQAMEQMMSNLP